jgi:hypothetical protein
VVRPRAHAGRLVPRWDYREPCMPRAMTAASEVHTTSASPLGGAFVSASRLSTAS